MTAPSSTSTDNEGSSGSEGSELETVWWELDVRSLALARVVLGSFVLLTLASTLGDMTAFFTDAGVLPRDVLVGSPFANSWLCFHLGSGSLATQALLNLLLAAFAVGLIAGYRTPLMVLGCWVLLNSLQARNPFIFDRGDLQLVLLLFWGFFLPLGARWSVDACRGRKPWGSARGVPAAALVAQFAMIYGFAAYLKSGPFWLTRADGLKHALISPLFATDLSLWLAEAAAPLLGFMNYAVIAGELFVAMLLLCPWAVPITRGFAVGLLLLFHGAVGLLFELGLFPWLGALTSLALLPREFWEGGGRRLGDGLDRRLGGAASLPEPWTDHEGWSRPRSAFLLGCLLLALASNVGTARPAVSHASSNPLRDLADALRLSQHWELFSPVPPYYGSFQLTVDGGGPGEVAAFEGPPTREAPGLTSFPSHRWRMLMIASLYPDFGVVRAGVARELARRAGVDSPQFKGLVYKFKVRLAGQTGELQPAVDWNLWYQQSGQGK